MAALSDAEPAIREQAVRILGRDLSRVGSVKRSPSPRRSGPRPRKSTSRRLLPLANDPDAGVRRELILAFRWLPTAEVGDALHDPGPKGWDGQDRWYLEALGLALADRETPYLADLLRRRAVRPAPDAGLDRDGGNGNVAVPPFFPADRNESYIAAGTPDRPATPLSQANRPGLAAPPPRGLARPPAGHALT